MRAVLALLPVLVVAAACSTAGTSILLNAVTAYPPTNADAVVLLSEAPSTRPHKVIALVEGVAATDDYLSEARTQRAAIDALKKEAARIGADAVILNGRSVAPYGYVGLGNAFVTRGPNAAVGSAVETSLGWQKIRFTGTAIKYEQ